MTTNYINYNVEKIANLEVAQDMALNDYFLIQPQDFNTKAKILPLKNMVVTLDNCTFAKQFSQHTSDIEYLKTSQIDGNRIQSSSLNGNSLINNTITNIKLDNNCITSRNITNKCISINNCDDDLQELIYNQPNNDNNSGNNINFAYNTLDNTMLSAINSWCIETGSGEYTYNGVYYPNDNLNLATSWNNHKFKTTYIYKIYYNKTDNTNILELFGNFNILNSNNDINNRECVDEYATHVKWCDENDNKLQFDNTNNMYITFSSLYDWYNGSTLHERFISRKPNQFTISDTYAISFHIIGKQKN